MVRTRFVDGETDSRLLVHEFSDAARINFMEEVDGRNPFIHTPRDDSSVFYESRMVVEKPLDLERRIDLRLQRPRAGSRTIFWMYIRWNFMTQGIWFMATEIRSHQSIIR